MTMLRFLLAAALALMPVSAYAGAGTITTKDAAGVTRTFVVVTDGTGNFVPSSVLCDATAAASCATVTSGRLVTAPTLLSGSVNSGAYASGAFASGALASGSIASGAMVDLLTFQGTKAAGTAAANSLLTGCVFNTSLPTLTTGQQAGLQCDSSARTYVTGTGGTFPVTQGTAANLNATVVGTGTFAVQAASTLAAETTKVIGVVRNADGTGNLLTSTANALDVNIKSGGNANGSAVSASSSPVVIASDQVAVPVNPTPYPKGATPYTASATGTTAATTATLAGASSVTTYLCGFSIRANATAAATGNATVTGTITGTLNFTQWTAPLASGLGITEMVFSPCVPASATNTSVAVVSAAPGTGGVVSVSSWGYKL